MCFTWRPRLLRLVCFRRVRVRAVQGSSSFTPKRFSFCSYLSYVIVTGAVTVFWVLIGASSLEETSETHFVEKMERSDRRKDCSLYRHLPVLSLDAQKLQQGFNM